MADKQFKDPLAEAARERLGESLSFVVDVLGYKVARAATGLPHLHELATANPFTDNAPAIDRLCDLHELLMRLLQMMREDEELARAWMLAQHPLLGGRTPVEMIRDDQGPSVFSVLGDLFRGPEHPIIPPPTNEGLTL